MWRCCAARAHLIRTVLVWSGAAVKAAELSWEGALSHCGRLCEGWSEWFGRPRPRPGHSVVRLASRTRSVVYLSSLIRSVIALHNLINNKLSNKEAERAVADDADKDKHKVRLDERTQQTGNCALVQHATCLVSVEAVVAIRWPSAARMDALEVRCCAGGRFVIAVVASRLSAAGEFGLALFDAGEERGR
jgi:hypothetical protein